VAWERALDRLAEGWGDGAETAAGAGLHAEPAAPAELRLEYRVDLRDSRMRDELVVALYGRLATDALPHPLELDERAVEAWPHPEDRRLLGMLLGSSAESRNEVRLRQCRRFARSVVRPGLYDVLLPALAGTGRLVADGGGEGTSIPLSWDPGPDYRVELRVHGDELTGYALGAMLVRDGEPIEATEPELVLSSGLVIHGGRCLIIGQRSHAAWALKLRATGEIAVPDGARDRFVVRLARLPDLPELRLPPELHWSRVQVEPRPVLRLDGLDDGADLTAELTFDYEGARISAAERGSFVVESDGRQLVRRDRCFERRMRQRLEQLGLRPVEGRWTLPRDRTGEVVRSLLGEGWGLESEAGPVRSAGPLRGRVRSGIDWFDLEGGLEFDGHTVPWPELLAAVRRGDPWVRLPDGTRGWIPPPLDGPLALARLGQATSFSLRFSAAQAGILDALLSGQAEVAADDRFRRLRSRPSSVEVHEPPGFKGRLRCYQREGVAWLRWLESVGCGGCLADDMGLGKTVQVLCWLQGRHIAGGSDGGPSLIVVPKSLLHNWAHEADKFTQLSCLVYAGPDRQRRLEDFSRTDLVVMTYGTLRSDILRLMELPFRTLVLDEAQAIKNPRSQAAKAVRLVRCNQRLAVSGTPIENGLEELWSLFDFLNPGMLGELATFAVPGREKDEAWLELLRRSLRPFMLRRTKDEVLTELPGKSEITLTVDLSSEERRRYDELRAHYRASLKDQIQSAGVAGARIQVLEALLRLRQAACHPGLLDPARVDEPSAKLDLLLDHVREVSSRGHKVLVFSQFTRLLHIVGRALEREGVRYAYLDGTTRDRSGAVGAFQTDPDRAVFLISLMAGGCGLNLTQSDYVYILDPWWNPAVEAQAVDRAYRMGQKNRVFAYRLIGAGTVEEKIMELKADKRRLADAVVASTDGPLGGLDAAALETLFSG
jgi:hypothetical protein